MQNQETVVLDMEEFNALDEKTKKGEASEEDEKRFEKLVQ